MPNVEAMLTTAHRVVLRSSSSESRGPRISRPVIVGALWCVLCAVDLLAPVYWIALAAAAATAAVATAVAIASGRARRTWPWWSVLAAITLFLAGNVVRQVDHTLSDLAGGRALIPDAIVIPGYVLLAVALLAFAHERGRGRHQGPSILLDGLMAAFALLACCWVFLLEPVLAHRQTGAVVRLVIIAYPALSLFSVVVTMQVAFGAGRTGAAADRYLVACISSMFVGDVLSTLAELDLISSPRLIDLFYATAFAAAAATALDPSMHSLTEPVNGSPPSWSVGRVGLVAVALSVPAVLLLRSGTGGAAERATLSTIILALTATAILQILQALRKAEQSEAGLAHQALHDSLTGLPNRRLMQRHLTEMLDRAASVGRPVALLFLDVDRFKLINDTVGHSLGDELLVQVAVRLRASVRPTDLVARIGGDEFVVVLGSTEAVSDALESANRLRDSLRTPFDVDGTEFFVTASIGLAFAPRGGEDATAEMLVRDADTAMYRAKEAGRDAVAVFDDSMRAQLAERLEIERDLRHAIARGQLHLAFQPIVATRTGSIVGVEALVRWLHPTLGVIVPKRFIPLAEESNLIVEIGSWVLDEALREIAHCRSLPGLENLRVSVNLSAAQLGDEMLVEHVGRALATNRLPGSALCLELTETVVMGDPEAALGAFAALRRLDVQLAIDDFGTEYSSLAYLQRLPVDTLKIDRSFVVGLGEPDSAADTLVAAIVAIARALGMETIAEGVESVDQARRVAALGCDAIQGYLYSRPVRADQLVDVVRMLSRADHSAARTEPTGRSGAHGGAAVA